MTSAAQRNEHLEREVRKLLRIIGSQQATIASQQHTIAALTQPHASPVTGFNIHIGGFMGQVNLSVDVQNEEVRSNWTDDKGDENPLLDQLPAGATITFTSSDDTVVTVGSSTPTTDGTTGFTAPLSFLKAGSVTITAEAGDGAGNVLPGFGTETIDLNLTPGEAAGLDVSVDGAAPVPAPAPGG